MAVELMMNYRNSSFVSEENAAVEAASGLQSVEKLIRLFSSHPPESDPATADYAAVADSAVDKFKNVISLLGRTRTGHARFRRAPVMTSPTSSSSSPNSVLQDNIVTSDQRDLPVALAEAHSNSRIYCPTPIQQVPPPDYPYNNRLKESAAKTISFSYSPPISRAISSLSGGGDTASFQIMSSVSNSAGKPPLSSSSSFKRKCTSSENAASGKCSGSSSRCQCSKRRKLRVKRVVMVPAISMKMADIPPDDYSWRKYGQKPIKGSHILGATTSAVRCEGVLLGNT